MILKELKLVLKMACNLIWANPIFRLNFCRQEALKNWWEIKMAADFHDIGLPFFGSCWHCFWLGFWFGWIFPGDASASVTDGAEQLSSTGSSILLQEEALMDKFQMPLLTTFYAGMLYQLNLNLNCCCISLYRWIQLSPVNLDFTGP